MVQDFPTPVSVEQELIRLRNANKEAYDWLRQSEATFEAALADYEIGRERAFLETFSSQISHDEKWTEARRKAYAMDAVAEQRLALAAATSTVRAARAKVAAVKTDVDIVRSVGTSVRTSFNLET